MQEEEEQLMEERKKRKEDKKKKEAAQKKVCGALEETPVLGGDSFFTSKNKCFLINLMF